MKRFFDFILTIILIIFLFPLFIILYILVYYKLGSPVFFSQNRPGKNSKIFRLYKFRTMTDEVDCNGILLDNSLRLNSFGKKLRSTSLDELPSLFNVFKGDMSLVGPRPLLIEYLPLYNNIQKQRHDVKPGVTGWAQVNGRNAISWEEKFMFDVWYVHNHSFLLDIKILFLTVKKVVIRDGINSSTNETMPKFKGNNIE